MKLRKILTSAFVILVCVAMLSTNVLAASVSITTGVDEDGKLKVTLSGDATGQVTFLATDASVALASVDGADIQYIDQIDKAASDRIITFAQRTGGENLVNIYAGGENVTTYASVANVYVVADAEVVDADYEYECEATADEFEAEGEVEAFFAENDLVVNYREVGSLASVAAEPITFSTANADDFVLTVGEPTGTVYPVAVEYKGIAAGSVNVTAVPPATLDSISATFPAEYEDEVWVEEGADAMAKESAVKAKVEAIKSSIAVTGTYVDPEGTASITTFDFSVVETAVAGVYDVYVTAGGKTSPEKITYTVRERAIESAEVTVNTGVNMKVPSIADVDAGVVEEYLAENLKASEFAAKYIWNDDAETPIALGALTFTATAGENNTWNVAVAEAKGLLNATIVVTLEEVTLTTITGTVTVQDKTGEVGDVYESAIPVGAVVTAMPYSDENPFGNVLNTYDNLEAYSTVVGNDGTFTLEVDPGHYTVIITHTKYINYWGDIFVTRTVMDEEAVYDVTLNEVGDNYDIEAELRYAYMGDINTDGTVNSDDFGLFTSFFGLSVPGLAD